MLVLSILFILVSSANAFNLNETATDITELVMAATQLNSTNATLNKTNIDLFRITQPSPKLNQRSDRNINASNPSKFDEFVGSPQLETYIEYNRYAVQPDPKNTIPYLPAKAEKQTQAKIKPSQLLGDNKIYYAQNDYYKTTTDTPLSTAQEKQEFPNLKYYERYNYNSGPSSFSNNLYTAPAVPEWYNKVVYPKPVMEHPYPFITDVTKLSVIPHTGMRGTDMAVAHYPKMNPWKHAAKLFAAILPIGLLISALTPNILTISTSNDTQELCRKLGRKTEASEDVTWSKPGCEARLLCETAVRKDDMDVESIKNLFWTYVSQNAEDANTSEDLEAVSRAIREKRCEKIECRQPGLKTTNNKNV